MKSSNLDNNIVVKSEKVVKEYRMGSNIVRALNGIDLEIRRGGFYSCLRPARPAGLPAEVY